MGLFGGNAQKKALAEKQRNEKRMEVRLDKGHLYIKPKASGFATIWRQEDGLIYCDTSPDSLYEVVGLDLYTNRTEEVQVTTGTNTGSQKRTGRVAGAVVGGVLLGPVGAVAGAVVGTGNSRTSEIVNQETRTVDISLPDYAVMKLKRYPHGPVSEVTVLESAERLDRFIDFIGAPELPREG